MLKTAPCCLLMLMLCSAAHAQYQINSTGDLGRDPGAVFAICDTGQTVTNPDTGQQVTECTLRALIETINEINAGDWATAGLVDWIETEAGSATTVIRPQTPLPPIEWPLHLDGTTHPDYVMDDLLVRLVIDGSELPGSSPQDENGLVILSGGSGTHLEAVNIRNFPGIGVAIIANGVRINRSRIGTNAFGTLPEGNLAGIFINGSENLIGNAPQLPEPGTQRVGRRNVISGNTNIGVEIFSGINNRIADNYIGTSIAANAAMPNGNIGIGVSGGTNSRIGDASAFNGQQRFAENFIAGHAFAGIVVQSADNQVRCNQLGWNGPQTQVLDKDTNGILLAGAGAANNTIGMQLCPNTILASESGIRLGIEGDPAGDSNLVSWNIIGTNADGADPGGLMLSGIDAFGGSGTGVHNNRVGHAELALRVGQGSPGLTATANEIGVLADGTAIPVLSGIAVEGGNGLVIGAQDAPNLIGNAPSGGIFLDAGTDGAELAYNFIGATPGGHSAPVGIGMNIDGSDHQIGPGNVVGHASSGIFLSSGGHLVTGNFIGTGNNGESFPIDLIGVVISSDDNELFNNRIGNAQFGVQISVGRVDNILRRNFIGTAGGLDFGNQLAGVVVAGTSNLIGGSLPADANQIGFNGGPGIRIAGSDNDVQRNFIGVTANGVAMGNAGPGIEIQPNAGPNRIGGDLAIGNTIGNNQLGVLVQADGNEILGNRFGWTLDGSVHPNQQAGVHIDTGINGSLVEGNIIVQPDGPGIALEAGAGSDNQLRFNLIGVDDDGAPLGGDPGTFGINAAGGTDTLIIGNRIGFTVDGIEIGSSSNNATLAGNAVGVLSDGTAMPLAGVGIRDHGQATVIGDANSPNLVGNTDSHGIRVETSATQAEVFGNWVGVTPSGASAAVGTIGIFVTGDGHVIGANNGGNVIAYASIGIQLSAPGGGAGNEVIGNRIGTGFNGEVWPIENFGINLTSANNLVRDNVIGNAFNGLQCSASSQDNLIQNNWFGVDENLNDLGNTNLGVILAGQNNVLGGVLVGRNPEANFIGFNQSDAVRVTGNGNQVLGNWVGVASDGTDMPNQGGGVVVLPLAEDSIIGLDLGRENVIAGNAVGIHLQASAEVRHNYIGTSPSLSGPGNTGHGLEIAAGVEAALIESNLIAANGGDGIAFHPDAGTANRITRTTLAGNAGKGIDLGPGGRDQDPGDFDTGPNNLQNFPEFDLRESGYNPSTGTIELVYRVDSDPAASSYPITVEIFLADPDVISAVGGFLGEVSYASADAQQWVSAELTPPAWADLQPDSLVSATATSADGNTSELSELFGMAPEFSISGEIQNLDGTIGLINVPLEDSLEVSGEGDLPFTMTALMFSGEAYELVIAPDGMPDGQECTVFNGEGIVGDTDITDIVVVCDADSWQIGGQINGLAGTITLTNQVNGDQVSVEGQGTTDFVFPQPLEDGESWEVVVTVQPSGQSCEVTENGSGQIDGEDRLDIQVACEDSDDPLFSDRFESSGN